MTVGDESPGGLLIHAHRLRERFGEQPELDPAELQATLGLASAAARWDVAAIVANTLAIAHRVMARTAEATEAVESALTYARHAASPPEEARALMTRAMIRLGQGDMAGASADLTTARSLVDIDPEQLVAGGVTAFHSGDLALAESMTREALSHNTISDNARLLALNNLGSMLMTRQPVEAVGFIREGLALVSPANTVLRAVLECNLGVALAESGAVPEALAAFDRLEELGRAHDLGEYQAEFDMEVSGLLGRLRLLPEARASAARGLNRLAGPGAALTRADSLVTAARLAIADGDLDAGRRLLSDAKALYEAQDRPVGVAITSVHALILDGSGDHAAMAGYAEQLAQSGLSRDAAWAWSQAASAAGEGRESAAAEDYLRRVVASDNADATLKAEALARIALAHSDFATARAHAVTALGIIDGRAALADAPDLRHRIATERATFELLLRDACVADSAAAQLDSLLRHRPPAQQPLAPGTAVDDQRAHWRDLSRRVESAQEDPFTLATLGADLAAVERRLRATEWTREGGSGGRAPFGLADLAAVAGCPLLVVARIGRDAVAFHHDDDRTERVVIGAWDQVLADMGQLTRGCARLATGGASDAAYAAVRSLAMDLDATLGAILPEEAGRELLVVLDRGLDSAPLTGLPRIWERAARFASLAVTAPVPQQPALPARPRVVVAEGPRLQYAADEAAEVAQGWGDDAPLTTGTGVSEMIGEADIAHFAAHATLRWDNPLQSSIHLHDGPLALTELIRLARVDAADRPRMRLLYLSACSLASAPSDAVMVGAVPMLAERVAAEVIASSIPLPDEAAPAVARAVYAAISSGHSAAAGLAQARAALGEDPERTGVRAALTCLAAYVAAP
ncbi:MAG: CHAT domain-containing protein [Actinobacteria bacterium]|nr:CHAT domain-containing protein [Actinomycetota bacterium]